MSEPSSPKTGGASESGGVDDSTMGDIIVKLGVLNYETAFCPLAKPAFSPLTSFYFSGPSSMDNPNTQFFYFTSLCAWLMGLCGHPFDAPGQFDDPNATATTILSEMRFLGLNLSSVSPSRLKQGSGEAVLVVLTALIDKALDAKGFRFAPIDYAQVEKYDEMADVADEDADVGENDEIEDKAELDSDDDDEMYVRAIGGAKEGRGETDRPPSPSVNVEEWNLEVERVAPYLQINAATMNDWRGRVESATVLLKAMDKMYPDVKQMLDRLGDDMDKAKDRIQKREQTLAQQFSEQVEDYRVKLRELNTSRDSANVAGQSVQQLTSELNQVSEVLEQTKRDIEERETKISDTTPLMQVKEAVVKVQAEIKQMSLRIGILQHGVLHHVMKHTKQKREGTSVGDADEDYTNDVGFD